MFFPVPFCTLCEVCVGWESNQLRLTGLVAFTRLARSLASWPGLNTTSVRVSDLSRRVVPLHLFTTNSPPNPEPEGRGGAVRCEAGLAKPNVRVRVRERQVCNLSIQVPQRPPKMMRISVWLTLPSSLPPFFIYIPGNVYTT